MIERPVRVAENARPMAVSPVTDVTPEDVASVTVAKTVVAIAPEVAAVRAMPQVEPAETTAPAEPAKPVDVAKPAEPPVAVAPVVTKSVVAKSVVAAPVVAEPAPAMTASLTPIAPERPLISTPMVFEAPKAADAQVLTEVAERRTRGDAAAPVAPKQSEKPAAGCGAGPAGEPRRRARSPWSFRSP